MGVENLIEVPEVLIYSQDYHFNFNSFDQNLAVVQRSLAIKIDP